MKASTSSAGARNRREITARRL